jgi:hypothetical protein
MPDVHKFLNDDMQVKQWPKKQVDKELVLQYLASKFGFDHSCSEHEVNETLKQWHTFGDWALLRRELYDGYYMDRDRSGTDYRRAK